MTDALTRQDGREFLRRPSAGVGPCCPQGNRAGDGMACTNSDRRQWRKQGAVVGAAASEMQANAKQLLGAATRISCLRRKLPDGLPYQLHFLKLEYLFRLQKGYFGVKVLFVNKKRTKLRTGKEKPRCKRILQHFASWLFLLSEWRDSNSRPPAPKAGALPTAQHPGIRRHCCTAGI